MAKASSAHRVGGWPATAPNSRPINSDDQLAFGPRVISVLGEALTSEHGVDEGMHADNAALVVVLGADPPEHHHDQTTFIADLSWQPYVFRLLLVLICYAPSTAGHLVLVV